MQSPWSLRVVYQSRLWCVLPRISREFCYKKRCVFHRRFNVGLLLTAISVVSAMLFYYTLGYLRVTFLLPRISSIGLSCVASCFSSRVLSGSASKVFSAFQVIRKLGALMRLLSVMLRRLSEKANMGDTQTESVLIRNS